MFWTFHKPFKKSRRRWLLCAYMTLTGVAMLLFSTAALASTEDSEAVRSPLQLYNDGAKKLRAGKLQEAEAALQSALATQNERIQSPSLYNLGEIRFQQGSDLLKKQGDQGNTSAHSRSAIENGSGALQAADEALKSDDLQTIVTAYMRGRGARRDLRGAREAVQKALETYGSVLAKWQRSLGDFQSADELRSMADAQTNSALLEKYIAKLIDLQKVMSQSMQTMGQERSNLKKKMDALKKKMPADMGEKLPGGSGEDADDDDEGDDKSRPQPKPGEEEPGKNGAEMMMTSEEAEHLLGMLKLDNGRKLSLGSDNGDKPKKFSGKNW